MNEYDCQCDPDEEDYVSPTSRPYRTTTVTTTESTIIEPVESEGDIECGCHEVHGATGYSTPTDQTIPTPTLPQQQRQRVVRKTVTRTVTSNDPDESDDCECDEDPGAANYATPVGQRIPTPTLPRTPHVVRRSEQEYNVSPGIKRVTRHTVRSKTRIPGLEEEEQQPRQHRRSRSIKSREEVGLDKKHPEKQGIQLTHYRPWLPCPELQPTMKPRRRCAAGTMPSYQAPTARTPFVIRPDTPPSAPTPRRSPSPDELRQQILQHQTPRDQQGLHAPRTRRHSEPISPEISPIEGHGGRVRGYSPPSGSFPRYGSSPHNSPETTPCPAYGSPEEGFITPPHVAQSPPRINRRMRASTVPCSTSFTPQVLFPCSPTSLDASASPEPLSPGSPRRTVCMADTASSSQANRSICYSPTAGRSSPSSRRHSTESPPSPSRRAGRSTNCSGCCGSGCCGGKSH